MEENVSGIFEIRMSFKGLQRLCGIAVGVLISCRWFRIDNGKIHYPTPFLCLTLKPDFV